MQGDIVAILDSNGAVVVQYKYDAWGNPISKTGSMKDSLGTLNPFRYRGYVYDEETGLYYLRTRYYSPTISRFISPDRYVYTAQGITSCDMYVYCCNMPVTYSDDSGQFLFTAIGTLVGGVIGAIDAGIKGEDIWEGAKDGAKTGAVAGAGFDVAGVALLVTGGSPAGIVVASAAITTSGTIAYGMATDSTIVMDISATYPTSLVGGQKHGVSLVMDFSGNEVDANLYLHSGFYFGNPSLSAGYSVGIVQNYNSPADYSGPFVDISGGYMVGADYCFDPRWWQGKPATGATSLTFGFDSSPSASIGFDWYFDPIEIY